LGILSEKIEIYLNNCIKGISDKEIDKMVNYPILIDVERNSNVEKGKNFR
jgi:hypothetical protein